MSKNSDWRSELEGVAAKLRDPFKMRMAVAGVTLAVMCFGINDPIHGRMKRSSRELNRMKKTVQTAEEVMLLRDHFGAIEDRIMKGKSNDVVVSHLIDIVRSEPVDLMRIDAQAPEKLGQMQTVRVMIDVHGSFEALTGLLHRFDADQYLIRVESVAISPPERDRSTPKMGVTLQIIKDAS
jgi:hypothetical protein